MWVSSSSLISHNYNQTSLRIVITEVITIFFCKYVFTKFIKTVHDFHTFSPSSQKAAAVYQNEKKY